MMMFKDKLKLCKEINTDPIYKEYSHGIRCCCFKDVHGIERLQVMHLGMHSYLESSSCNDWEEYLLLDWIMNATHVLKVRLGLFDLGEI